MSSDLRSRLLKASTSENVAILSKSKMFNEKDILRTKIPMLNIALSGELGGGMKSGLTIFAGPSKHFKSNMALTVVSAFMKKYEDAICLFYDSEFGITPEYLSAMGVNPDRVVHTPIVSVEQIKIDMANQLKAVQRGEKVIVLIDSIGNMASKKEIEDAENEKTTADMTRAKAMKSLFRIVTPYFSTKNIPCIAINHTIETIEMFSKTVMTGGTGPMYAADTVFYIGKRQIKDGTELEGFQFVLNAEKSRYVKEKSKFFIDVTFEGGIDPYSGLLDMALELGMVVKPKNGWYARELTIDGEKRRETKSWRAKDTKCTEFWGPLFKSQEFRDAIEKRYKLSAIENNIEVENEIADIINGKLDNTGAGISFGESQSSAEVEDELENFE
ncbi:UvsX RecA-like recombination protein [Acinetobacter phage Ac42]|uniref:DNA repair protein n=1 Tax=Acinetobacter phage Ac42 TaxID=762660 RepID=UPI0001EBCCE3|nr:DNA repair protein [Acinetobacter phage Ac42]ADI96311.1 UvsX RecA-like recombination protein [Acinetobacter phage Ac42]